MRNSNWILFIYLVVVLAAGCSGVQQASQSERASTQAPIIDRNLLFGDPAISNSQLSPDGKFISFIKPYKMVRNIWIKAIDEPFDKAIPITSDKSPVPGYFWSRDSKFVLYVQDKGGNENFHVYAVDPRATTENESGVPKALDLTPVDGISASISALPKNKPEEIIIGLNDRDAAYHDVYRVEIATAKRELMIKNTQHVGFYTFDLEGNVRLAYRQNEEAGADILRVDGDKLTKIYQCSFEESCSPIRFHKDNQRCYFISNKGSDVDLTGLMLLDPKTGNTEMVESDPEKQVDFGNAIFSEATEELIATAYLGDRQRIYPKNAQIKKDLATLRAKLPAGELALLSMSRDMNSFMVSVSSDVDPGSVYLYHRKTGAANLLFRSRPDLPSEHLAHMKPVRYKARDGLDIPAYLTVPRGVKPDRLPTVVFPHGGPWDRDTWGYDAYTQFLANRGYAVLQMNFRSSTGYGKKFLNAGNRQWGTGSMQHDITDGVRWLIDNGISDPKKICIFGGSYGGYATLAGVAFTPDLYACGVPYVAPSNIITLLESIPPYWKPFAKSFYKRIGDPEVEADRKDMESRSPLFFTDRIKVPLLVVHGANDPRVKQAEADSIVVALRDKGHAVEYLVAKDEGHGFRSPENRLALSVALENFLAKHIGGRTQKGLEAKLAQQLSKITVDPASVKMPNVHEKALLERAMTTPLPTLNGLSIKPVTRSYKAQVTMGEKKTEFEIKVEIDRIETQSPKRLRMTTSTKMPMSPQQVDVFDFDLSNLLPIERKVEGQAKLHLAFGRELITGEMVMGSRKLPINMKLEAPVFGDGAGLEMAIAGLPLKESYQTTLRIFDPMTQKVRPLKLEVTGRKNIQVAAGEFGVWTLTLTPLDNESGGSGILEVNDRAPHFVIKSEYQLPTMMGGGKVSSELSAIAKRGKK